MRAFVIYRYGGPEVLEAVDLPSPVPAPGETLVRIRAIAVNPADAKWRAGLFAGFMPVNFPHVLGYDVAGEVIGGTGWPPGTRVFGMLDPISKGGYAEQVAIPAAQLAEVPRQLDFPTAAALPTAALTGLQLVEDALDVHPGQRILITGAVGAVGHAAVHIAKARGAIVVAAVRMTQLDEAFALGADEAILLDAEYLGAPFDHVVDTVGGQAVARLCAHLKPDGRIVTVATAPILVEGLGAQPEFYSVRPDGAQLVRLAALVASGAMTVPIARILPLSEVAEAHVVVERGGAGGKLILQP